MRRLIFAVVTALLISAPHLKAQDRIGVQAFGGFTAVEDQGLPIAVGVFFDFDGISVSFDADVRNDDGLVAFGFGRQIDKYGAYVYLGTSLKDSQTMREGAGDMMYEDATEYNVLGLSHAGVGVSRSFLALRWLTNGRDHTVQLGVMWAPIG